MEALIAGAYITTFSFPYVNEEDHCSKWLPLLQPSSLSENVMINQSLHPVQKGYIVGTKNEPLCFNIKLHLVFFWRVLINTV